MLKVDFSGRFWCALRIAIDVDGKGYAQDITDLNEDCLDLQSLYTLHSAKKLCT